MTDLSSFERPEGAPEPGACVRVDRPEAGLAVVVLDPPHRRIAVFDQPLLADLDAALDELEADGGLRGVVLTGREPTSFSAGADIDALAAITDPELGRALAAVGQEVFERLARLPARTVAAVGGPVPGGAYEICLACDLIVAADHPSTRIGLPETRLGILPGWGGCQRLPRRIGVPRALDAILSGRLLPPIPAKRRGLIDRITPPEYLLRVACDIAMGRTRARAHSRGRAAWLVDRNPLAIALIRRSASKALRTRTRGRYPAPERALELVCAAPTRPLKRGLAEEARALGELAVSPECKHLVSIFRLSEEARKADRLEGSERARGFARVGVVGGGVMGGAIAGLAAERGMEARLADLEQRALDEAVLQHRERQSERLKRRRVQRHEADAALDRLETTRDAIGFGRCELLLEAIVEELEVKRRVLARFAELLPPQAVIATNTSSLSVGAISEDLPDPSRVVGVHFFNPVARMPLVEIVPGPATSEEVVARAARFALDLGKTPVIVRDAPGFLVNRLLGPYLDEAGCLLAEGVPPSRIDELALRFGMPMGPLELLDEIGFDVAARAGRSLHEALGERMRPQEVLERMIEAGFLGKKNGRGFYEGSGRKRRLREDLASHLPRSGEVGAQLDDREVIDRMILAMLAEAARCLEEEVVRGAGQLDLASVLGMGFPPFRGGILSHADSLGAKNLVRRLEELAARPHVARRPGGPERFRPAELLQRLAGSGGRLREA